jgi:hypothetical protein
MKDVNYPLRTAYKIALQGIVYDSDPVAIYAGEAPPNNEQKYYIVFGSITNNDISTKQTSDTQTQIRVTIFTRADGSNSGKAVDFIAGQVFEKVYDVPTFNLSVSGFQVIDTKLASDNTQEWENNAQLKLVDRTLVFSHNIFHK